MSRTRRTALISIAAVGLMFGLSFAAVPLYRAFCQLTGFGGTPRLVQGVPSTPTDRMMEIRFDANIDPDLPWQFRPEETSMRVPVGEVVTAYYLADNLSASETTGSATFNVVPDQSGYYFTKIDCFCFTKQTLAAGEESRMPVIFRIDPKINEDDSMDKIATMTLSYTFYPIPNEED